MAMIMIPIAFIFPLAMKNFPWVVLISQSSIVSQVVAILVCLTSYLACILIGLVVLNLGLFRPAPRRWQKSHGYRHAIVGCVTLVVMDMFMSYSIMVVNDMHMGVAVLVEKPSFTSQFLSSLPFSIKSTLLAPASHLVGMLATLFALWALSFMVALGLSVLAKILLPLDTYTRLRFVTIIVVTFMVMKYMVDKSSLIAGMKASLLGLAGWFSYYHVPYLVVRYVTFLALALLPADGYYHKAAVIISIGVVLTMRPGLSMPIEKPALNCKSLSATAAVSASALDDFIRLSEEMMVEHKMAMEKIVSEFNLLIEESKWEIKSFVVHTILVMMTLLGGTAFYVRNQYSAWIKTLEEKVPRWMKK